MTALGAENALAAAAGARFAGVWVGWNRPAAFQAFGEDADGPWLGFQVRRTIFEAALLQRAAALGVDVRCGAAATVPLKRDSRIQGAEVDGRPLRSRLLIDASGPARWLSRRLQLPTERRSPPLTARYGYVRGACPLRDAAPALLADRAGWRWSARVDDGVYQWVRLDLQGRALDHPPDELAQLPAAGPVRGADVTWRLCRASAGPGWFLAGDAAATVDPTSSKGVLKALASGLFAGRAAAAMLSRGAPEPKGAEAYRAWIESGFEGEVAALAPLYRELGVVGFGPVAPNRDRRLERRP